MGIDGKRLKALREKQGLYLQDMADYLDITRQAYMKYENGQTRNPRKLEKLAQFFHVTTDYLLGRDDNKPVQQNPPSASSPSQICELFETCHGKNNIEAVKLFAQLDTEDQAEIRGEMKQMLKGEKYSSKESLLNA